MKITYKSLCHESITVHCDGKTLGRIKKEDGGFRYWPLGVSKKFSSELFPVLKDLKKSLEEE